MRKIQWKCRIKFKIENIEKFKEEFKYDKIAIKFKEMKWKSHKRLVAEGSNPYEIDWANCFDELQLFLLIFCLTISKFIIKTSTKNVPKIIK